MNFIKETAKLAAKVTAVTFGIFAGTALASKVFPEIQKHND